VTAFEREVPSKVYANGDMKPIVIRHPGRRPEADLIPFHTTSITAEDTPILKGIPTKVPLWVRCTPVLSSEGEFISSARLGPTEIDLGSDVRFIATPETNDATTGTWSPYVAGIGNYFMTQPVFAQRPVYEELSYISGREIINNGSYRISGGTRFQCRFNDGLDAPSEFTMAIVLAPNPQDEAYPILDWWHAAPPEARERLSLWLGDRLDFRWAGTGGSVDPIAPLNKARPMYIVVTMRTDELSVTVAHSARHAYTTVKPSPVGSIFQRTRFQIGGSDLVTMTDENEADFNLLEVDYWARSMPPSEITTTIAQLSSVYGVADEWR
jgi:hypothetical protein